MPLAGARLGYEHKQISELIGAILILSPQVVAALIAVRVATLAEEWVANRY